MVLPRTCDRCYKIKARCFFETSAIACSRCGRLGHSCETKRAILQPGRPRTRYDTDELPAPGHPTVSPVTCSTSPNTIVSESRLIPLLKDFNEHEILLVEFTLQPTQIASLIYGQSFYSSMREAIASQLFSTTDLVKDGFMAFAKALLNHHNVKLAEPIPISHTASSSKALQGLRRLEATSAENARTALAIALMLVTHNDLCVGATTLPIVRSALLLTAPYRQQLMRCTAEENDPNLICLLFVEMNECIVRAQIPIFRYDPPPDNSIVDRYYGICHELLPILYDICVLFNAIKAGKMSHEEMSLYGWGLISLINQWKPELALSLRDSMIVDKDELYHFLLQARAFKAATELLLIQTQLSHEAVVLARFKAHELRSQISEAMRQGLGKPKYLLFPYFVACLELHGADEEQNDVSNNMNEISNGLAPMACQSMVACLQHIWRNRRKRPDLTWFECVNEGLPFAMGP